MLQKIIKKNNTGFTLVETLVGVTVFALVVSIAIGLFVHVLESQRKALAYQELFDQTSFVMEYLTRGVRMAKRQRTATEPISPQCIPVGHNYQLISPNHLRFIRHDRTAPFPHFICYEFRSRLVNNINRLEVSKDRGSTWAFLTSPRLEVTNLRFRVEGDGLQTPPEQPRVTIVLEVRGREYGIGRRATIHLQTTVSQRDLDF